MSHKVTEREERNKVKRLWALIISAIVAVALTVTCAVCLNSPANRASVSEADGAVPEHSVAAYGNSNYTSFGDSTRNGTVRAGDYMEVSYTYTVSGSTVTISGSYSVMLGKGTYFLEVWGGKGGNDGCQTGYGGYTFGEYTATGNVTLYAVCGNGNIGGVASETAKYVYNGGGWAGSYGSSGAGGGATHISTVSGELSDANKNSALIVAGGGGGNGNGAAGNGGAGGGGNNNGGAGDQCTGGTQTAAGSGYSAGSGVKGGNRSGGLEATTAGTYDGGGGGGGWYGGGAAYADTGGAGGSGHIGAVANGGGQNGVNNGVGKARITFLCGDNGKTNHGALTENAFYDKQAVGTVKPGDYLTYVAPGDTANSDGLSTNVNLYPGVYRLEVWGAKGGNDSAGSGGKGGYTYGIYTISDSGGKTLYVVLGGMFTGSGSKPGFNGGGNSGTYGSSGSGGGASQISTAAGVLTDGNKGNALVIAGGGGGTGQTIGGEGGGGNGNGGPGDQCTGGTQDAAGSGYSAGSGVRGGNRSGGLEAATAGTYDGGGGGGGWYGGGAAYSDKGGAGGSGHIGAVSNGGGSNGSRLSGGMARITVINSAPGTKNKTYSSYNLGGSLTVNIGDIAVDPEGTALAFTNGAASNLTTFTAGTNVSLFVDPACTKKADSYIDWSITTTSINITKIKKLPREGVDGYANNTFTFYARVRDSYGGATAHNWTVISFKVKMNAVSSSKNAGSFTSNGYTYTYTAASPGVITLDKALRHQEKVDIDISKLMTNPNPTYYALYAVPSAANTSLFNYNGSTTASVYDWTSGSTYSAAMTGYSTLRINHVNASNADQSITFTVYLVEKSSIKGNYYEPPAVTYPQGNTYTVKFRLDNDRPVLKNGVSNVVPLEIGKTSAVNLNTYFSDLNDATITASTHSITNVIVPTEEYIELDKHGNVVSTAGKGGATSSNSYYNVSGGTHANSLNTGVSTGVSTNFDPKIAFKTGSVADINEAFIEYSFSGVNINLKGLRASYSLYDRPSSTAYTGGTQSAPTGTSTVANPGHFYLLINVKDNRDPGDAGIWLPLAITVAAADKGISPVDTGTYAGTVNKVTGATDESGQSIVADMPTARGNVDESFYFIPMAVNIGGTQHKIASKVFDGDTEIAQNLWQPLALDADNFTYANGLSTWSNKLNEFISITSTPADIVATVDNNDRKATSAEPTLKDYISASYIDVYYDNSWFGGRVSAGSSASINAATGKNTVALTAKDSYYVGKGIKITLKSPTMDRYFFATVNYTDSAQHSGSSKIAIKVNNIAPKSVAADDVAKYDNGVGSITYSEKTDPSLGKVPTIHYKVPIGSTFFITPYDLVEDVNMDEAGAVRPTVTDGGNAYSRFTLNGLTGKYNKTDGKFTVGGTATVDETAISALLDASLYGASSDYFANLKTMLQRMKNKKTPVNDVATVNTFTYDKSSTSTEHKSDSVYNERLFFARTSDATGDAYTFNPTGFTEYDSAMSYLTGYITYGFGDSINISGDDYPLDFMVFSATTRTLTSASVRLTVRDRHGDSLHIEVIIDVVNTPPVLDMSKTEAIELVSTPGDGSTVINKSQFQPWDVMYDMDDGNNISYMTNRGLIVARGNKLKDISSFDELYNEDKTVKEAYKSLLYDDDDNLISEKYVSATLTSAVFIDVTAISSTKNIKEGVFVYFFVRDNFGGTALGYKQIEVNNVAPTLNTEENGFNSVDSTWMIESTRKSDITRQRYIVGSSDTAKLLKDSSADITDNDIKVFANDTDKLQHNVLSQRGTNESDYVNYGANVKTDITYGNKTYTPSTSDTYDYALAVPNVTSAYKYSVNDTEYSAFTFADSNPAAIAVYKSVTDGSGNPGSSSKPDTLTPVLIFYVNGAWYERDALVTALNAEKTAGSVTDLHDACFDAEGRWLVGDWALRIATSEAFESYKLGITVSVRDDVKFGGDTAGLYTAYNVKRTEPNVSVKGTMSASVYMFISGTGIRTKDAYADYNGYYVVEDPDTESKPLSERVVYLPTYNSGTAGGELFNASTASSVTGAYKYPDVISVPGKSAIGGDAYKTVYVPMSYFGVMDAFASHDTNDASKVAYSTSYVAYNTSAAPGYNNSTGYSKSDADVIKYALTLSDGKDSWTGERLKDNPYLDITPVDYTSASAVGTAKTHFGDALSSSYYNLALSVPSNEFTPKDVGGVKTITGGTLIASDKAVHLTEQADEMVEHNFGLSFTKKDVRTGATNLTLTVALAQSKEGTTAGSTVMSTTASNGVTSLSDTRSVSVAISVGNSYIELVDSASESETVKTPNNVLKYEDTTPDDGKDNGVYYVDVSMASSATQTFGLVRNYAVDETTHATIVDPNDELSSTYKYLYYNDDDYTSDTNYRDYAYFSLDSVNGFNATNGKLPSELDDDANVFVNTSSADRMQSSMLNYYGNNVSNVTAAFSANPDYNNYFAVSTLNSGRAMSIIANRKTIINENALVKIANKKYSTTAASIDDLTVAQIKGVYADRGLVAKVSESGGEKSIDKVYYPLKVLVYDSRGGGWNSGSYAAIEFRITITNAAPTLKTDITKEVSGDDTVREFRFSLAVTGEATYNLYDFIRDPDFVTVKIVDVSYIATEKNLGSLDLSNPANELMYETSDYLESPYVNNYSAYGTTQQALENGQAGLSPANSKVADVIMYMPTSDNDSVSNNTVPTKNEIKFKVNRRTTDSDGQIINQFKFTLTFRDNHYGEGGLHEETQKLRFVVTVTNDAPEITTDVTNVTMRINDYFRLLPAYYDTFVGDSSGLKDSYTDADFATDPKTKNKYLLPMYGSAAFLHSKTYNEYFNKSYPPEVLHWNYYDITSDKYGESAKTDTAFKTSTTASGTNMGFLGLAKDDTPWQLRFYDVAIAQSSSKGILSIATEYETAIEPVPASLIKTGPIALRIKALSACSSFGVTFKLLDGEGGTVSHRIDFTIISTKPEARDGSDSNLANSHLEGVKTGGSFESATYSTYIIPSGGSSGVKVKLKDRGEEDKDAKEKTAYKDVKITLKDVARDPDGDDQTQSLKLYGGGMFYVNNRAISSVGGKWTSDYFYIDRQDATNDNAFTIHATGYNPDRECEELSFYISDSGNDIFENALKITIKVYTIYSDMINTDISDSMNYNGYCAGSEKVSVAARDEYVGLGNYAGSINVNKPTVFNYIAFDGNDAPIVDLDNDKSGTHVYNAYIYAFMNDEGKLSAETVAGLMKKRANGISLDQEKQAEFDPYLIGSIVQGETIESANRTLIATVNKYVQFSFASDGASISFIPQNATLGKDLLMYIQVVKSVGDRDAQRADDSVSVGAVFSLEIKNSAPRAVKDNNAPVEYDRTVTMYKGDTAKFKIFDQDDEYGSLFADSDDGDNVVIKGFDPKDASNKDYKTALGSQVDTLDWAADSKSGKQRAFTVAIDGNELSITVNRRIDQLDGDRYLDQVSFILKFTGIDMNGNGGLTCDTFIRVIVCNTPITAKNDYVNISDSRTNAGYSFKRNYDVAEYNEYIMDAKIVSDGSITVNLVDILTDADYVKDADVDSYVFVGSTRVTGYSYLEDESLFAELYVDEYTPSIKLATITPIFTELGADGHKSFTAIKIEANASVRNEVGTVYVRVVDRATDTEEVEAGIYIQINVTIMNTAPETLPDKENTVENMLGSDSSPEMHSYFIGDYVTDRNESDVTDMTLPGVDSSCDTYLRIVSAVYLDYNDIWTTQAATLPEDGVARDSSLLFNFSYGDGVDLYSQKFTITPNKGYYGSGEIEITVADGDITEHEDTEFTSFRITVNVEYNPQQIGSLNGITTARGKTQYITIEKLIPEIKNTFDTTEESVALARAGSSFNPANWYVLESVSADKDAQDYVEIKQQDSKTWSLRATTETASAKRINVTYSLASDPSVKQQSYFMLTITSNLQPIIRYKQMTFERYPEEVTGDPTKELDTSNTAYLRVDQLFDDPEDDVLKFISVKSNKSALVSASFTENNEKLAIKFTARGTAEITVTVSDETDNNYSYVFTVVNSDLAEPDLWTRFLASFESNKVMWAIIIACIILAIIILIIVIAIIKKRKHEREELEALLVSEMEIEEQMLKLAGAPTPTGYQSYGYLQSTPGQYVDPSMLLGTGAPAPDPTQLGLAAPPPAQGPQMQAPQPDSDGVDSINTQNDDFN